MTMQGKIWGSTSEIFQGNNVEMHRIFVKPNGYSSKHKHDSKYNLFYVESGRLTVRIWEAALEADETMLARGDTCIVRPGVFHQFYAPEHCVAYEVYWVELRPDIVRMSKGGVE